MRAGWLALAAAAAAVLVACAAPTPAKKKEAQARMEMGITYLNQRNLPAAMRELTSASAMDPTNAEIDMALGLAYQARGDVGTAERHFRDAVDKKSNYPEAHNNLGVLLANSGRGAEAIREFEAAAADVVYQTPEIAYYNLGEEYRRQKELEKAEAAYRRAIALNDRYAPAWRSLAMLLAGRSKDDAAAEVLVRCLTLVPDYAPGWLDLGAAYARLGKRREAVEAYRNVLGNTEDPALRKTAGDAISRLEAEKR